MQPMMMMQPQSSSKLGYVMLLLAISALSVLGVWIVYSPDEDDEKKKDDKKDDKKDEKDKTPPPKTETNKDLNLSFDVKGGENTEIKASCATTTSHPQFSEVKYGVNDVFLTDAAMVNRHCHGKNPCILKDYNTMFGQDPVPGVVKEFSGKYKCVDTATTEPPPKPITNTYTFHKHVDSAGGDIELRRDLIDKVTELEAACNLIPECVGFNTNGWLKSKIRPTSEWSDSPGHDKKGLYVHDQRSK